MWRWISPYNDIDPDSLLLRQMAGDHYRDHWQPNRLLSYTLCWFAIGAGVTALALFLFVQLNQFNAVGIILFLSFFAGLVLDFRVLTTTTKVFRGEQAPFDRNPLTAVDRVWALNAIGQLRNWGWMSVFCGVRGMVVVFLLLEGLDREFSYVGLLAFVYVVELYWRMQALVALEVRVTSRFRHSYRVVLVSIGLTIAITLLEVGILFAGLQVILAPATEALFRYLYDHRSQYNQPACCTDEIDADLLKIETAIDNALLVFALVMLPVLYGFFRILREWGLRGAVRRLERFSE